MLNPARPAKSRRTVQPGVRRESRSPQELDIPIPDKLKSSGQHVRKDGRALSTKANRVPGRLTIQIPRVAHGQHYP